MFLKINSGDAIKVTPDSFNTEEGFGLRAQYANDKIFNDYILNNSQNSEIKNIINEYIATNDKKISNFITQNGIKIDCIIDTVGNLDLVSQLLPFLSDQGRCILVSLPKKGTSLTVLDPNKLFGTEGQRILTTQAGGFDPDTDIKRFIKLYQMGKIDYKSLITHRFKLDDINEAIETLKSGGAGRIMIQI